jgi:predicted DNA-binding transcriptional regulator AlpA
MPRAGQIPALDGICAPSICSSRPACRLRWSNGDRSGWKGTPTVLPRKVGLAMDSDLMTVKDVAAVLKVSERMVWKLLASDRFPQPARLGRAVRWSEECIARFCECGCDMSRFEAAQAEVTK